MYSLLKEFSTNFIKLRINTHGQYLKQKKKIYCVSVNSMKKKISMELIQRAKCNRENVFFRDKEFRRNL